jgi:succinate dehydrogenase/fumarate reductase flavoprotein subunit
MSETTTFDVIVLGSGAAGMAAALTASVEGCRVLLIERSDRIGGSTAISGGAVWAPLNAQSAAAGHPDTVDKVWTYLQNTVGDAAPEAMQRAYINAGPGMVEWMHRHTQLRLVARTFSPDYYPDRDGAAMGGRSLDPAEFDGRLLGRHFSQLRDPLPEFMVLGGMMVSMTDAKHLLAVTKSFASWKHGMKLVLRYASDRLRGYHRGTRLLLGNALAARLFKSVLDRGIEYRLSTQVTELLREQGRVCGVTLADGGTLRATRGVVVATGGFPWSESLRSELYPQPTGPWSMSPQGNRGEGIALSRQAGAAMGTGHSDAAFWAPVSLLQRPDGSTVRYPHLVWDRAKPGLMAVNGAGQRFVNESTSYHEFVRGMYRSHATPCPPFPAFLVCDSRFHVERWGMGLALPGGRPARAPGACWLPGEGRLAGRTGGGALKMDATNLQARPSSSTSGRAGRGHRFRQGQHGLQPLPGRCRSPAQPLPGAAAHGAVLRRARLRRGHRHRLRHALQRTCTCAGRKVQPVDGLYVVGNDMHSVMGGQYPAPGITLGPALTFGWLAGRHVAAHNPRLRNTR